MLSGAGSKSISQQTQWNSESNRSFGAPSVLSARTSGAIAIAVTIGLGAIAGGAGGQAVSATRALRYPAIPIEYSHLANGLKVVLARDTTTPVVVVAVYYGVGQRTEGHGQEGFAHLFEHLMFEGSTHLGPGELLRLISSNGGTLNGNTRYDFTDYFEIVPPCPHRVLGPEKTTGRQPLVRAPAGLANSPRASARTTGCRPG